MQIPFEDSRCREISGYHEYIPNRRARRKKTLHTEFPVSCRNIFIWTLPWAIKWYVDRLVELLPLNSGSRHIEQPKNYFFSVFYIHIYLLFLYSTIFSLSNLPELCTHCSRDRWSLWLTKFCIKIESNHPKTVIRLGSLFVRRKSISIHSVIAREFMGI